MRAGAPDEAAAALLAALAGRWTLTREIDDRQAGETGRLDGLATLERDGTGWLYREEGQLRIGDRAPLKAERRLIWRAEGAKVAVFFGDGRAFHRFDARGLRAEAGHDCAPDRYDVAYTFDLPQGWQAVWEVAGPRKAYRMVSRYRRASGAA